MRKKLSIQDGYQWLSCSVGERYYDDILDLKVAIENALTPREQYVINGLFGITMENIKRKTLAEVIGISPGRIGQIATHSITKIRDYLENYVKEKRIKMINDKYSEIHKILKEKGML